MNDESKRILKSSLIGTASLMWVAGGSTTVWTVFGIHWLLGWGALFVWVWGCWAGLLYFNLTRYFEFDTDWYRRRRSKEVWVASESLRSDHGLVIPQGTELIHEAHMPEGFARLVLSINVEGETLALFETRQEQKDFLPIPYWVESGLE